MIYVTDWIIAHDENNRPYIDFERMLQAMLKRSVPSDTIEKARTSLPFAPGGLRAGIDSDGKWHAIHDVSLCTPTL